MAGGQERILRGRIRSMQATKKITRAMELIAASRIVKAQQRVASAVPYSELITNVVWKRILFGRRSDRFPDTAVTRGGLRQYRQRPWTGDDDDR